MKIFPTKLCIDGKVHNMVKYYGGEYRRYKEGEAGVQESRGQTYQEFAICKKCGMKGE